MNMNQIINMVIRIFMRKILGRGIDAGINMATRRGGSEQDQALAPEQRERGANGPKNRPQGAPGSQTHATIGTVLTENACRALINQIRNEPRELKVLSWNVEYF